MRNQDVIIGANGQVGKAIYKCYEDDNKPFTFDIKDDTKYCEGYLKDINCMHVCIPFFDKDQFIEGVERGIKLFNPKIIIIHSTVPFCITREIYEKVKGKITAIAHSPCVGVHPNLYESIKFVFPKKFGCIPEHEWSNVFGVLKLNLGLNHVVKYNSPEETEVAKMLSTTVYAHHIAIVTEIKRICEQLNLSFDNVFTNWTNDYNLGYQRLNKAHFTRPILYPCEKGAILGHCVKENIKLLKKYMPETWLTDLKPKRLLGENE